MKTRYAKPFEGVQVKIPYETGMNPYSGLFEFMESKKLITKQGNRYKYITNSGEEILEFRKNWGPDQYAVVMQEFGNKQKIMAEEQEDFEHDEVDVELEVQEAQN